MLFEVVTRANPLGITGEEFMRRLPDGIVYMKGLMAKGLIVHCWIRVGGYGGTSIFSVDSHAELLDLLNANPVVPHISFEVIPLIPLEGFELTGSA